MIGPSKGPIDQTERAVPRSSCTNMSAIVPPPNVMAADPAIPSRNRNPINMLKLLDRAHAIVETTNTEFVALKMGFLPYSSESGAIKRGPKA